MPEALRTFPNGIEAFFKEAPGGDDVDDINSLRNRPAAHPEDWLANIRLHSDLDYFEVSHEASVTINHASVAAGSLPDGVTIAFGWRAASDDHLLVQHNLGYEPFALVAWGNNILWPGMPVQTQSDSGARYVTYYCTGTQVRLYEWASIGSGDLSAVSRQYKVLVFKAPPAPSGARLFEFDPQTGHVRLARGKIDTSRRYLAVVPGGSPLGLSTGRMIDLKNGAPRAVRPLGTVFDPVPSGLKLGLARPAAGGGYPYVFGGSLAYNGGFTGSPAVQVQAP